MVKAHNYLPHDSASFKAYQRTTCLLTLSQASHGFYVSAVQVSSKHCGKKRNCLYQAILPFPTVFSICLENFLTFSLNLNLSSVSLSVWNSQKFVVREKVKMKLTLVSSSILKTSSLALPDITLFPSLDTSSSSSSNGAP